MEHVPRGMTITEVQQIRSVLQSALQPAILSGGKTLPVLDVDTTIQCDVLTFC
jgi:hypothetical protein